MSHISCDSALETLRRAVIMKVNAKEQNITTRRSLLVKGWSGWARHTEIAWWWLHS